jgi:hypothetical protein
MQLTYQFVEQQHAMIYTAPEHRWKGSITYAWNHYSFDRTRIPDWFYGLLPDYKEPSEQNGVYHTNCRICSLFFAFACGCLLVGVPLDGAVYTACRSGCLRRCAFDKAGKEGKSV